MQGEGCCEEKNWGGGVVKKLGGGALILFLGGWGV